MLVGELHELVGHRRSIAEIDRRGQDNPGGVVGKVSQSLMGDVVELQEIDMANTFKVFVLRIRFARGEIKMFENLCNGYHFDGETLLSAAE